MFTAFFRGSYMLAASEFARAFSFLNFYIRRKNNEDEQGSYYGRVCDNDRAGNGAFVFKAV